MDRVALGLDARPYMPTLTDRRQEVARRMAMGQSRKQIAEEMGYHPQSITVMKNDPEFKELKESIHAKRDAGAADITRTIRDGASKGAKFLVNVLTEGTEEAKVASTAIKVKVAQDLLDREGTAPKVTKQNSASLNVGVALTGDDIAQIKRAARGGGGDVIDV